MYDDDVSVANVPGSVFEREPAVDEPENKGGKLEDVEEARGLEGALMGGEEEDEEEEETEAGGDE